MSPTVRVVPSTAPRCSAREVQVSPVHVLAVAERLLRCAQDLCAATASAAQGESVPSFSHRISRRTRLLAAVRRTPRCRRAWEAGMSLPDGSAQQEVEGGDRPMRFNVAVRRLTPRIPMTAPLTRAASCACGQFWHDKESEKRLNRSTSVYVQLLAAPEPPRLRESSQLGAGEAFKGGPASGAMDGGGSAAADASQAAGGASRVGLLEAAHERMRWHVGAACLCVMRTATRRLLRSPAPRGAGPYCGRCLEGPRSNHTNLAASLVTLPSHRSLTGACRSSTLSCL